MHSPLHRLSLCTFVASAILFAVPTSPAQEAVPTTQPVSVVPHLIKYSGALPGASSSASTVDVKFSLYAGQAGGEALWTETQQVSLDTTGKYSVVLGSMTAAGVPDSVFANGQARWIGVTLGNEQESARTILVATPYSLKASDSETLGGHPVSDFTLKSALPAAGTDITQINVSNGVTGGGTGPTVTLGLSSTYLENLGNEIYPQLGGTNTLTGMNKYTAGNLLISGSPALSVANVSASSPVTVTASGSTVKIGLSDSALLTLGNGVYAQLSAANTLSGNNTFTGANTFSKAVAFASGQTFPGTVSLSANNTFTGANTFANGTSGGTAIYGTASGSGSYGVYGNADVGVYGASTTNNGVNGYSTNSGSSGVFGEATSGNGVYGKTTSATGYGTFGGNNNSSGTGDGVRGSVNSVSGYGVHAIAVGASKVGATRFTAAGIGLALWADTNVTGVPTNTSYGALGATADDNGAGWFANNSSNANTIFAENLGSAGNGLAVPVFAAVGNTGACGINGIGDVTCSGRLQTAVPLADKTTQVEVYAVQSSENWFEDFGSGQLFNGSAKVAIDPEFAQIVNTGVAYHVFLTPKGNCKGLFVTNEGANEFEVRELGDGGSSVEFDYRIVAKRNGHESERLADATAEMHTMTARRDQISAAQANQRPVQPVPAEQKEISGLRLLPAPHTPLPRSAANHHESGAAATE